MRRLTLASFVLATLGCATGQAPTTTHGPVPPADWVASEAVRTTAPGEPTWWRSFEDPMLDELVAEALAANPSLEAAAARLAQASARTRATGAAARPAIDATGTGARQRQSFLGFPIPGAGDEVLSTTTTTWGIALNISWEIDVWGRVAAERGAATAVEAAVAEELAAARLSLAGQAAKAWFAVLEAAEQESLARSDLDNRRRIRRRIERRYAAGLRPALDLRLARSDEASAVAALARRVETREGLVRSLEVLLGRYPSGTLLEGVEPRTLPDPPAGLPDPGLPTELLARRPDLRAAERRLEAAGFELSAARAALYPRLALGGSVGRRGLEPEDLADSEFGLWNVVGNLVQPVFQGGRLRAAVALAEARRAELGPAWVAAALEAWSEVERLLATEGALRERIVALAQAAHEAERAARLANSRYEAGLADYLSVLTSERQATAAAGLHTAARREELTARVDLYLALGGGVSAAEHANGNGLEASDD